MLKKNGNALTGVVVLLRLERGLKVPKTLVLTITPQDKPRFREKAMQK